MCKTWTTGSGRDCNNRRGAHRPGLARHHHFPGPSALGAYAAISPSNDATTRCRRWSMPARPQQSGGQAVHRPSLHHRRDQERRARDVDQVTDMDPRRVLLQHPLTVDQGPFHPTTGGQCSAVGDTVDFRHSSRRAHCVRTQSSERPRSEGTTSTLAGSFASGISRSSMSTHPAFRNDGSKRADVRSAAYEDDNRALLQPDAAGAQSKTPR
jgi:hypothetical protein